MRRNVCSVLALTLLAHVSVAQEARQEKLKPADATLKELPPLSVGGVRELSDGRVLFLMGYLPGPKPGTFTPGYMAVSDMKSGRIDSVPGMPEDNPIPFAADTTMLRSSGGWVFAKGLKILGTLEATNPVVRAARDLIGLDTSGFVVATRMKGADSTDVVRINRSTAEEELIARLKPSAPFRGPAPMYNGVREYAVYGLDGWLGVQRVAPLRVDWRSPNGSWKLGKPIPIPIVTFDDREKLAYATEQARLSGDSVGKFLRRNGAWPAAAEPSYGGRPMLTSDGKMIVYRTPTADYPNARYDVVNREGVAERQIMMGPNETIVGFGAKSVYVRTGFRMSSVQLERHPWP